jgi:ABC-2 type transport system permease protein
MLEPQKIGTFNTIGLMTLIKREVDRFINVYAQTIVAPVITTLMFYTIFALAFGGMTRMVANVPFLEFLAPGLIMMTMVQNAFANTSSSLVISKIQGSIVDILMPPLSNLEICIGFIVGGLLRGLVVGVCTALAISVFVTLHIHSIGMIVVYAVLGTVLLSAIGVAAGIWSDKFDHIAAVTNFIVTPLTFLSGTFYSVESLPELWQGIAHFNPFFYMIDGFRAGFIGHADGHPGIGIAVLLAMNVLTVGLAYFMLRTGYKIKS